MNIVTSVKRKRDGFQCSRGTTGRSATEVFQVEFDSVNDLRSAGVKAEIANAGGVRIPQPGEYLQTDMTRIVTNVSARPSPQNVKVWEVTVSYSVSFDTPGGDEDPDPTKEETGWRFDGQNVTENVDIDSDGQPIVNSVGESQILSRDYADFIVTMTKNIKRGTVATHLENMAKYSNTTNSERFLIADDVEHWKLLPPQGVLQRHPVYGDYYSMVFQAVYREKQLRKGVPFWPGWWTRFLNEGTYEIRPDPADGNKLKKLPIYVDGVRLSTPVALSARTLDGVHMLQPDDDPVYKTAILYKPSNWVTWLNDLGVLA